MTKPIMSAEVESMVNDAISQYQHKDKWKAWGMDMFREQGSCILLEGPPGTGKTTIARWAAAKIKKGFKKLSVAQTAQGSGGPGSAEASLIEFFDDCRERGNATIFIDEVDHMLGDRRKITGDAITWMLGCLETLMTQMNTYPGLIICATNHAQDLDPAVADRFMYIIRVDRPDFQMRQKLWKTKWPEKFPFRPTEADINKLASYDLSGRQIETVFVNVASNAIRRSVKPNLAMFTKLCDIEAKKHIESKFDLQ